MGQNGEIVAVGGYLNDGNGPLSGHVRVFSLNKDGNTWEQIGADIEGEASYDYSGSSIALSRNGNVIAIGAYGNDGNGFNSGHARVYSYNDDTLEWEKMGRDIEGKNPGDNAGYFNGVSLSDNGKIL